MRWPPPSGGPTKGALALRKAVQEHHPKLTSDNVPDGIYNARCVQGHPFTGVWCHTPSQHAYGLAVDFMTKDLQLGSAIAADLVELAPIGVKEIIWNRRIWTPGKGWQPYTGRSPHTDHVHVALTQNAGATLTQEVIDLWLGQEDQQMTPAQWAAFNEFRGAVQKNDEGTQSLIQAARKEIASLSARLERIEQAVAQPVTVTAESVADLVLDGLADRLKD